MEDSIRYAYREELNRRVMSFVEDHETTVNKSIVPLAPKILIFVLPKEHRFGRIILPDQRQNKPVYEGIVVRTFKPYWRVVTTKHGVDLETGVSTGWDVAEIEVKPTVAVGDHVLFQHFVGVPVPFMDYDMHKFRLVNDNEFIGVLEYDRKMQEQVAEVIHAMYQGEEVMTPEDIDILTRRLIDNFVIVLRDDTSKTLSGVGEYSGQ